MKKSHLTPYLVAGLLAVAASVYTHAAAPRLAVQARWDAGINCPLDSADDDCSVSGQGERCLTIEAGEPAFDTACNAELYHQAGR